MIFGKLGQVDSIGAIAKKWEGRGRKEEKGGDEGGGGETRV